MNVRFLKFRSKFVRFQTSSTVSSKTNLIGLTKDEILTNIKALDIPSPQMRTNQIWDWIYNKGNLN